MGEERTGALVSRIDHGGPADGLLRTGDVLTELDGHSVANDWTVEWPGVGRVLAEVVVQSRQIGDALRATILRDGKNVDLTLKLVAHQRLVPGRRAEGGPQYLVFGGLVFQPLTFEYLQYFEDVPMDLANHALYYNVATDERRQIILLQKVLPHAVNRGYHEWEDIVVATVNGTAPRDMRHLAQILDGAAGPWLTIVSDDVAMLALDLEAARAAQPEILAAFGISRDRSPDLEPGTAAPRRPVEARKVAARDQSP
jgi:hypothetical protein